MSDALSIFQRPHAPPLSASDAADLARLREQERLRTEGRLAAVEISVVDLTARAVR
jgi:hypothetical protein